MNLYKVKTKVSLDKTWFYQVNYVVAENIERVSELYPNAGSIKLKYNVEILSK